MKNFREKLIVLADIIELRVIERHSKKQQAVKTPTVFGMLWDGKQLTCKWTACLTDEERKLMVARLHIRQEGFTSEEWDSLGKQFSAYIND